MMTDVYNTLRHHDTSESECTYCTLNTECRLRLQDNFNCLIDSLVVSFINDDNDNDTLNGQGAVTYSNSSDLPQSEAASILQSEFGAAAAAESEESGPSSCTSPRQHQMEPSLSVSLSVENLLNNDECLYNACSVKFSSTCSVSLSLGVVNCQTVKHQTISNLNLRNLRL